MLRGRESGMHDFGMSSIESWSWTPVHLAIQLFEEDQVGTLLRFAIEHGVILDQTNDEARSLLYVAADIADGAIIHGGIWEELKRHKLCLGPTTMVA